MKLSDALASAKMVQKQREVMSQCEEIVSLIEADPEITRSKISELTGMSTDTVGNRLESLKEKGILSYKRIWVLHCD
jgi:DNA-binding Lrp family transcriptional regulator